MKGKLAKGKYESGVAVVKSIFGWIARHAVLFALLVAAILLSWWLQSSYQSYGELQRTEQQFVSGQSELEAFVATIESAAAQELAGLQSLGKAELESQLVSAKQERGAYQRACSNDMGKLLSGGVDAVIANRKACLELALADRKIGALEAFRDTADARQVGESLPDALKRQASILTVTSNSLNSEADALRAFSDDYIPDPIQTIQINQHQSRVVALRREADNAARNVKLLTASQAASRHAEKLSEIASNQYLVEYRSVAEKQSEQLAGNAMQRLRLWAESNQVDRAMKAAAIALLGIILAPYLIRIFCYFVLAPIAMRRPPVQILSGETAEGAISATVPSGVSMPISLKSDEEMLIRQGYLQSLSGTADEKTQWLLDSKHPVMSLATGLSFLTRVTGEGQVATVSAIHDPFAEVMTVNIAENGACILHPRSIVAVTHHKYHPLQITAHWRVFSIHAWLTGQWRYYVFRGPVKIILKGGRGVRVEQAQDGRIFGQHQLTGFSAHLRYAIIRTGTFWPYFLRREPLIKDRVVGDDGVLILEEAPLSSWKAGKPKGGIEGMLDAGLKLFGM